MLELELRLSRPGFGLDATASLPGRGVTGIFGRSACGKTTLLRCIAGLEPQAQGRVTLDEEPWQAPGIFLPAHRRGAGFVFQESSLFEHLDVRGNLQYGLRRVPAGRQRLRLEDVAALFDLSSLLSQRTPALSGGQRQRVAMARALLASPRLLLLDEPLSSLDQHSRAEILPHLERLRDNAGIPILYVSHSLAEIMRIADHLLLLESGRVRACGPLQQLLARTDLPFSHLAEGGAVFNARIDSHDEAFHLTYAQTAAGRLAIARRDAPPGTGVRVRIDARDVSLTLERPRRSSILNVLPARVEELSEEDEPGQVLVRLNAGGEPLLARITRRSAVELGIAPGLDLYAQVKGVALMDGSGLE